ncbi:MAG: PP2C family serine/threonine-protein phosphatase [Acidobacteriota bacterium]
MDNSVRISSGSVSDRGLSEKRPDNEDSYLEMSQCGIYAVADGVGGAQAGDVASQMAMEILGEAFANLHETSDAETVMRTAIERANSAIHQMAQELPQLSSMATTIVALHLTGDIATIGHVGDSRLYRVDREGNLFRETDDHSMVAEEVRAGRMTEEQAENHPSRSIISRALGAETTVDIDLKTIMVEPGTAFLICSDGITRHVNDQEIKGVLTFGGDPAEICDYLKNTCYERGAEDNLTAVVVKIAAAEGQAVGAAPIVYREPEEVTIATARPAFEAISDDDEDLLGLSDHELSKPETPLELPEDDESDENTIPILPDEENQKYSSFAESGSMTIPAMETHAAVPSSVSSFSDDTLPIHDDAKPSLLIKAATAAAWIILGGVIGFWGSNLFFAPRPIETTNETGLTEMQSSNQPLSAFEENRRTVDRMPAEALARFGKDPRDAEDFFLVGRSYMLLGQYAEAKQAFGQSRTLIASGAPNTVDPNNRKTLETEIAIAMAVLNDSTVETILKTQLESSTKSGTNVNSNITPAR